MRAGGSTGEPGFWPRWNDQSPEPGPPPSAGGRVALGMFMVAANRATARPNRTERSWVGPFRPTDLAARSAAKIFGSERPDRPTLFGRLQAKIEGRNAVFHAFEPYLVNMWYIAYIPDSGRPDRPTRPRRFDRVGPTRPTDPPQSPPGTQSRTSPPHRPHVVKLGLYIILLC